MILGSNEHVLQIKGGSGMDLVSMIAFVRYAICAPPPPPPLNNREIGVV